MSYFSYSSCIAALENMLEYKEKINTEIKKNINEKEISNIILDYYDIQSEYCYISGGKKSKK